MLRRVFVLGLLLVSTLGAAEAPAKRASNAGAAGSDPTRLALEADVMADDNASLAEAFRIERELETGQGDASVPSKLRRLRDIEVSAALLERAQWLVQREGHRSVGTEIPVTADGHHYVAKIELHYHPEGGATKPWGYHHGISMFAVETD
jgi:hypothetical protein